MGVDADVFGNAFTPNHQPEVKKPTPQELRYLEAIRRPDGFTIGQHWRELQGMPNASLLGSYICRAIKTVSSGYFALVCFTVLYVLLKTFRRFHKPAAKPLMHS